MHTTKLLICVLVQQKAITAPVPNFVFVLLHLSCLKEGIGYDLSYLNAIALQSGLGA